MKTKRMSRMGALCAFLMVICMMAVTMIPDKASAGVNDTFSATFPDTKMAKAMAGALGAQPGDVITQSMVDNLTTVDLSGKGIRKINGIETFVNLERLDLNDNEISSMPSTIGTLTNLKFLDLGYNYLEALPGEFANLTGLEELYLDMNEFEDFPMVITGMTGLKDLRIGSNYLMELPMELTNLIQLETFYAEENSLESIPPEVFNMAITDKDFSMQMIMEDLKSGLANKDYTLDAIPLLTQYLQYVPFHEFKYELGTETGEFVEFTPVIADGKITIPANLLKKSGEYMFVAYIEDGLLAESAYMGIFEVKANGTVVPRDPDPTSKLPAKTSTIKSPKTSDATNLPMVAVMSLLLISGGALLISRKKFN